MFQASNLGTATPLWYTQKGSCGNMSQIFRSFDKLCSQLSRVMLFLAKNGERGYNSFKDHESLEIKGKERSEPMLSAWQNYLNIALWSRWLELSPTSWYK